MATDPTHPFASGGGGTVFEYRVAARLAADLLSGRLTEFGGRIVALELQTPVAGFDDLELRVELLSGAWRRSHVQIRHRQPLTGSDTKFSQLVAAARGMVDSDPSSFRSGLRRLVIAVSSTSPGYRSFQDLVVLARDHDDPERFREAVSAHQGRVSERLDHFLVASGMNHSDAHRVLSAMDLVAYDLKNLTSGGTLETINDLARLWTPIDHARASSLLATLYFHVSDKGTRGASLGYSSLRASLGSALAGSTGVSSRRSRLEALLSESSGRVLGRLRASGVPDRLAEPLAVSALSGADNPVRSDDVSVLVGVMGIGKSTALERCYRMAINEAIASPKAPVPIFLDARVIKGLDIKSAASAAAEGLGDPQETGAAVFLDGLDEAGLRPSDISHEAHRVVGGWPGSTVLMASRPSRDPSSLETVPAPTLNSEGLTRLLALLEVDESTIRFARDELASALECPFFAIRYALAPQFSGVPSLSKAQIVDQFASEVVRGLPDPVDRSIGLLTRLAVRVIDAGGKPVNRADLVATPGELRDIEESRLVAANGDELSFQLAILTEWFASRAILDGTMDVRDIVVDPRRAWLWRYALAQAIAGSSSDQIDALLEAFAKAGPAWLAWTVEEVTPPWGGHGQGLWTEPVLREGARLRRSTEAIRTGLGPLGARVTPSGQGDSLPSLGVASNPTSFAGSWHAGEEKLAPVVPLPEGALGTGDWREWRLVTQRSGAIWPWEWAVDQARDQLESLLGSYRLLSEIELFHGELAWHLANQVVDTDASLRSSPISIDQLREQVDGLRQSHPAPADVIVGFKQWHLRDAEMLLGYLESKGLDRVTPAWPSADQQGGWTWDWWSTDQLLARLQVSTAAALHGYEDLVHRHFAAFAPDLATYQLFPCELVGRLTPGRYGGGLEGIPQFTWYLRPSATGKTCATWTVETSPSTFANIDWDELKAYQNSLRPDIEGVARLSVHSGEPDVYSPTPAGSLALRLLADDLTRFEWYRGHLPSESDIPGVPPVVGRPVGGSPLS